MRLLLSLSRPNYLQRRIFIYFHFNIRLTRRKIVFWALGRSSQIPFLARSLKISIFTISCYKDLSFFHSSFHCFKSSSTNTCESWQERKIFYIYFIDKKRLAGHCLRQAKPSSLMALRRENFLLFFFLRQQDE